MRLPLVFLWSCLLAACSARVLWTGDAGAGAGGAGASSVVEPMGIWDEVPCPGYFDGLTCPAGCPERVEEHAGDGAPGKVYCASPCSDDEACALGTLCHEGRYCVFGPCEPSAWHCRFGTACWSDQPFCAPADNNVPCSPFHVAEVTDFVCPYDACYASLELPDGTTFCTIDCAFASPTTPCVVGADCPWGEPLPDGRTLCLPICESDADCFGGLTCRDAICQWPAAAP